MGVSWESYGCLMGVSWVSYGSLMGRLQGSYGAHCENPKISHTHACTRARTHARTHSLTLPELERPLHNVGSLCHVSTQALSRKVFHRTMAELEPFGLKLRHGAAEDSAFKA